MKQIVLVDDNQLVLQALEESMDWESLGCVVQKSIDNAAQALGYCQCHPLDLLITDIKMPVMSGLDLILALKNKGLTFATILITGFNDFEFARQALLLGATDIILKPIDNQDLTVAVQRAFAPTATATVPPTPTAMASIPPPKANSQTHYHRFVEKALAHLRANLDKRISLDMLADYMGISSSHLSRLVKQECQKSFVEVYNEMRIEMAIEYLGTGKYRICEVSNMVGIENYAYFYQLFKKLTGKSPKEYL